MKKQRWQAIRGVLVAAIGVNMLLGVLLMLGPGAPDGGRIASAEDGGIRVIAFYSTDFHTHAANSRLWTTWMAEWAAVKHVAVNPVGQETLRPSELGYYDQRDTHVRRMQGSLAREYGVHGFAYQHQWFPDDADGRHTGTVLAALLRDGEPDIPFMLVWMNRAHTTRLDGGIVERTVRQTYGSEPDWRCHFDALLPFFKHRRAITVDGRPVFVVFDLSPDAVHEAQFASMFRLWREWAQEEGLPGIHVLGCLTQSDLGSSTHTSPWLDGLLEVHPDVVQSFVRDQSLSVPQLHQAQYPGAYVHWDDTAKRSVTHTSDVPGAYLNHPAVFRDVLVRQFRRLRARPGLAPKFFFLNAWNEWMTGNTLEPSLQFGRSYLEALRGALEDARADETPGAVTPDAFLRERERICGPMPPQRTTYDYEKMGRVCFVVRTYRGHDHSYGHTASGSLQLLLRSLHELHNPNWIAVVFNTDPSPFLHLRQIVQDHGDHRVMVLDLPLATRRAYSPNDAAYTATDYVVERIPAIVDDIRWLVCTNGDNSYLPHALDYLDPQFDLIGLNFYSRYASFELGTSQMTPHDRCARLAPGRFEVGSTDLGCNIMNFPRYLLERRRFSPLTSIWEQCQDGLMVEGLIDSGWRVKTPPDDTVQLFHNPCPEFCYLWGGIWFDSTHLSEFDCLSHQQTSQLFQQKGDQLDHVFFRHVPHCVRYKPDLVLKGAVGTFKHPRRPKPRGSEPRAMGPGWWHNPT